MFSSLKNGNGQYRTTLRLNNKININQCFESHFLLSRELRFYVLTHYLYALFVIVKLFLV